ncbi:putative protease [Formivibrio citricus]|uniref:Putative protease n=1 Tax=Formivibrio citricus TaxID=83765 RepID=A0A1I5A8G8_9NEIS|nr:U32 family peptidase [Formivibrio citricus]SFN58429.1 putative protease [Formivibrio citricus]
MIERKSLELLAPAKNLETGVEAINHGADAVYIGGPAFGARAAAGNPVEDIEKLAAHAHRFSARVYVTFNTILFDHELAEAERLVRQLYEAGADALIVQDMGLLQLDLPPIALHASTQTDNRTPEKVRFLQDAGFSQVVLARELSLAQIREIADQTRVNLEFFIHGALCVSYSGQCYISHAQTGRSANRGECAQLCRLPWTLLDEAGQVLAQDRHLLSLKDMNQTANLRALVEAGISSFKIEGRLKDVSYVKNVTAHYRQQLDRILEDLPDYRRASCGRSEFFFTPQPQKSFNRGFTDYFLNERQTGIGSFLTPKFAGEPAGKVVRFGADWLEIDSPLEFHNGDGISFFNIKDELVGVRINRVAGGRLYPAEPVPGLQAGTAIYRNLDHEFEKLLTGKSAERRIDVDLRLSDTADGFVLTVTDEEGIGATASMTCLKEPARDEARARTTIAEQLCKLGNTMFRAGNIHLDIACGWFIPVSALNALRRQAVEALEAARAAAYVRPAKAMALSPPVRHPEKMLSWQGNVSNQAARSWYLEHGVNEVSDAYECNRETGQVPLMVTKHCLRHDFGACPKQAKGIRPEPWRLVRGQDGYALRFDCKRCEMQVLGELKKVRSKKH